MAALSSAQGEARPLVLLVEDAVMQRLELTETLEQAGFRVVPVATAAEALEVVNAKPEIRVIVTDVNLSSKDLSGIALAQKLSRERKIAAVLISGEIAPDAGELPVGAHFVAKPIHEATLLRLIRDLISSTGVAIELPRKGLPAQTLAGPELTLRQHEVLALLVQGKSNREIAEALGLSENTVKVHLVAIFRGLGVSSRVEAVLAGMKRLPLREAASG